MHQEPGTERLLLTNTVLLASRLLLAWIFIHEGAYLVVNFSNASAGMTKAGIPVPALIATIVLQLAAGIALAVGWRTRFATAALGLFCLATAVLFHKNFAARNELLHFEKDFAIAGGMFVLMIQGAGKWSIDELLRSVPKREFRQSKKIVAAHRDSRPDFV